MLGISPTLSLNELHKKPTRYGKSDNGRALYTNDNLQKTLDGLSSQAKGSGHQAYHASAVTRAVNGLRAGAAPANSFMKPGQPNRRCVVHSGFEIEYELNHTGLNQTDIYIVDIRLLETKVDEDDRAGLWRTKAEKGGGWSAEQWQPQLTALTSSGKDHPNRIKVGINGYCDDKDHAARMLPSHITRGQQSELDQLKSTGYQLLYVPTPHNVFKAGWQSIQQMGRVKSDKNQVEAAQILAAHMLEAHQQGLHVEWTSHRGGSFVLTEAMKLLAKPQPDTQKPVNLEGKQRVFFSDPTTSMIEADQARRQINTDTRDNKWYNGSAQNLGYSVGGQQLGMAPIVCSLNGAAHETASRKAGAYTAWGAGAAAGGFGLYQAATGVAASAGVSASLLGAVVNAVLANIPSLNEDYNSSPVQASASLANKIANKIR